METTNVSNLFDQLLNYGFNTPTYMKDSYCMENVARGYSITIDKKDGAYFLYAYSKIKDNPIDMVRLTALSNIWHDDRI